MIIESRPASIFNLKFCCFSVLLDYKTRLLTWLLIIIYWPHLKAWNYTIRKYDKYKLNTYILCTYYYKLCTYVRNYVRTYVRMYGMVCMYVCTYVCMYIYVCMYVRTYKRTYVRMYVCIYVCLYVCMYLCMYICMYVCMYYVCMYVSVSVHVYTPDVKNWLVKLGRITSCSCTLCEWHTLLDHDHSTGPGDISDYEKSIFKFLTFRPSQYPVSSWYSCLSRLLG